MDPKTDLPWPHEAGQLSNFLWSTIFVSCIFVLSDYVDRELGRKCPHGFRCMLGINAPGTRMPCRLPFLGLAMFSKTDVSVSELRARHVLWLMQRLSQFNEARHNHLVRDF